MSAEKKSTSPDWADRLPKTRGSYRFNAALAPTNWFRVGGAADVIFKPADTQDLADFLGALDDDVPVTALGVGSNVIVRDGGIDGVVIKLGRGFADIALDEDGETIIAGAAALDVNVARFAANHARDHLAFLVGIPGTIGGALKMNAGAYGTEIKDVLIRCEAVDRNGNIHTFSVEDCHYTYRHFGGPDGLIFTRAWLKTKAGNADDIIAAMNEISAKREETQPIRSRTGGSTFANPKGHKAWQLIDEAGCRGLQIGHAQISEKHCNFMINLGDASAADLERLGETVREKVKRDLGVTLSWEIQRIGRN